MIEVNFDSTRWRSSAAHAEEGAWQSVKRFRDSEAGVFDPLPLLSQLKRC